MGELVWTRGGGWQDDDQTSDPEPSPAPTPDPQTLGRGSFDLPGSRVEAPSVDPLAGYSGAEQEWLRRNRNPDGSYDTHRVTAALSNNTSARPYDSQTTNPFQQQANSFIDRNPGDYARIATALSNVPGQPGPASGPSTETRREILHPPASGNGPAFANTSPLFSDPASSLLENYALDQFGRRINPDPNSGTALYEQYARELIDTLRQPVYSPQDEAILKTRATNAIEQERSATQQRWIEELSARNIPRSSGIALDGLQRIEDHFNGLRTQAEAQFATDAIAQTRQNRLQVLDTAGALAGEEETRLQDAGNYARVPYDLQERAFQRNLQMVNAAGDPAQLTNSALGIGQFLQNNTRLTDASALDRAQLALQIAQGGSSREVALAQLAAQREALQSGNNAAQTAALLQLIGYWATR